MAQVVLITQADLEARLTAETVRQAYDDNFDGVPDTAALDRIRADASSYVLEAVEDLYKGGASWPLTAPYPIALVRIALDVAVAYTAQRHPEYVRRDWERLFKWVDAQLDRLRARERSAGETPPSPPADEPTVYTDARRGW